MYPNVGKYTSPLDGMGYLISKLQGFEDEVISVISIYISCHIYDSIFAFFSHVPHICNQLMPFCFGLLKD